jgi:hypothetical protein
LDELKPTKGDWALLVSALIVLLGVGSIVVAVLDAIGDWIFANL